MVLTTAVCYKFWQVVIENKMEDYLSIRPKVTFTGFCSQETWNVSRLSGLGWGQETTDISGQLTGNRNNIPSHDCFVVEMSGSFQVSLVFSSVAKYIFWHLLDDIFDNFLLASVWTGQSKHVNCSGKRCWIVKFIIQSRGEITKLSTCMCLKPAASWCSLIWSFVTGSEVVENMSKTYKNCLLVTTARCVALQLVNKSD